MTPEQAMQKAALTMTRYRVPADEQVEVIRTLLDAGVEKCLQEQQRILDRDNDLISRVATSFKGNVN